MLDHELLVEIRRDNLRALASEYGGPAKLAIALGKSEGQLSHLIGKNAFKPIGEKLAREIEDKIGKPKGFLDKVHGVNDRLLRDVMKHVDTVLRDEKKRINDDARSELISLCYKLYAQHNADRMLIRDVVLLTIRAK